jgi:hypothetical protein
LPKINKYNIIHYCKTPNLQHSLSNTGFHTSNDGNPTVHPAECICSLGRIEHTKGGWYSHLEGFTPSVKKISDALIDELDEIGNLCGFEPLEKFYFENEGALQNMLSSSTPTSGSTSYQSQGNYPRC